jgi:hypothetical protein
MAEQGDPTTTAAYKALTERFGAAISLASLTKIAAESTGKAKGVKAPNADAKKTTAALYQWFQANWDAISPILDDLASPDDEEEEEEDQGNDEE